MSSKDKRIEQLENKVEKLENAVSMPTRREALAAGGLLGAGALLGGGTEGAEAQTANGTIGDGNQDYNVNNVDANSVSTEKVGFDSNPVGQGTVADLRAKGKPDHNVRAYGAAGDGSTDDTEAFNDAILATVPGDVILVPQGEYLVEGGELEISTDNVSLVGDGQIIQQSTGDLISLYADGCCVEGLYIDGNKNVTDNRDHDVSSWGAISVYASDCDVIRNHVIASGNAGVEVKGDSEMTLSGVSVRNNYFEGNLQPDVSIHYTDGIDVTNNIHHITDDDLKTGIQPYKYVSGGRVHGNHLFAGYISDDQPISVGHSSSAPGTVHGVEISGNHIYRSTNRMIQVREDVTGISIQQNHFHECSGTVFTVESSESISVCNNNWIDHSGRCVSLYGDDSVIADNTVILQPEDEYAFDVRGDATSIVSNDVTGCRLATIQGIGVSVSHNSVNGGGIASFGIVSNADSEVFVGNVFRNMADGVTYISGPSADAEIVANQEL